MKKLFFLAMVALGMTAACQKPNVEVENPDLDDNAPVEVKFGVYAPTITVTKTKAAVDDWDEETVYVYGFDNAVDDLTTDKVLIDGKAATVEANATDINGAEADRSTLTFTPDTYNVNKYYYEVNAVYNFYAYYTGKEETVKKDGTKLTAEVTIDGSQDVMLATTNPTADIALAKQTYPDANINSTRVYSAYAARRGVHPTLNFEHMLSRFTFKIVKGYTPSAPANTASVKVTEIEVETYDSGTLDITAKKFDPITTDGKEFMTVTAFTEEVPSENPTKSYDFMTFPGESTMNLKVYLEPENKDTDDNLKNIELDPMEVTLDAAKITGKTGATFEAGKRYTVTITVYSLEEVQVSASLTEWVDGGWDVYDPDEEYDTSVIKTKATLNGQNVVIYSATAIANGVKVYKNSAFTLPAEDGDYTTEITRETKKYDVTFTVTGGVVSNYTENEHVEA